VFIWYDMMICYHMIWWYDIWYVWCDMTWYDMIHDIWYGRIRYDTMWYDMGWYDIWYDTKYLTAIGLPPGGSSTVHIYTQTINRTTHSTQTIHRTTQSTQIIHRTTQFSN